MAERNAKRKMQSRVGPPGDFGSRRTRKLQSVRGFRRVREIVFFEMFHTSKDGPLGGGPEMLPKVVVRNVCLQTIALSNVLCMTQVS